MTSLNESDIAYNFVIAGDGRTYEGRGWRTKPGFGVENDSLLIAFLGNNNFFKYLFPRIVLINTSKINLR